MVIGRCGPWPGIHAGRLIRPVVAMPPKRLARVRRQAGHVLAAKGLMLGGDSVIPSRETGVPLAQVARPQHWRALFRPGIGQLSLCGMAVVVGAADKRPTGGLRPGRGGVARCGGAGRRILVRDVCLCKSWLRRGRRQHQHRRHEQSDNRFAQSRHHPSHSVEPALRRRPRRQPRQCSRFYTTGDIGAASR